MKNQPMIISQIAAVCIILFMHSGCSEKKTMASQLEAKPPVALNFNGFESQIKWGEHLVITAGCNDCHTPKKMSPFGSVLDSARWLSGRPADMPPIAIDRKEIESKGLAVTSDLTEWVGPWGVSYAANLTPDPTGIGSWDEYQFIYSLREGKAKGVPGSRNLLPPMPWQNYGQMTDDELKAMFAYLKSVKPVQNLVLPPLPPVSMAN